jgi:hypothetical protein
MNTHKLKFSFCYVDCNNFKEKDLIIFNNLVKNARIGRDLKFDSYANILFDESDTKHEFPILTKLQSFTRGKTNAILYTMPIDEYNDGTFTHCMIYQTTNKNTGSYGALFYNLETELFSHIYNIEYNPNDLVQHLQRVVLNIPFRKTFNALMENTRKLKKNTVM